MRHEILYQPAYSLLKMHLEPGESVRAESGVMVSMSPTIQMQTQARGGILKSLARTVLGGESFFINTFTASAPGEVTFAPSLPGDISAVGLQGRTIYAQSGSYLVSTNDVEVDTKWGGAKTFFSGEGLFLLRMQGQGNVYLSSYGAIHTIDLQPGQQYIMDTGHMVAFSETVGYNVERVGGLRSTLLGGEGLVVRLTGPGRVWMQTRSEDSLLSWLIPRMPSGREH